MKLLVVDNAHIYKLRDGNYYSKSIHNYALFTRYISVFGNVRLAAKVKVLDQFPDENFKIVSGPGLEIFEISWYIGPKQMLLNMHKLIGEFKKASEGCDACIYRVAQVESFMVYKFSPKKMKFALEVVNDPKSFNDMFFGIRWFFVRMLKKMIKKASAVSYVTEKYLQRNYPINDNDVITSSYSSVKLDNEDIRVAKEYKLLDKNKPFRIAHVSNNITGYAKGHKTVIDVIYNLVEKGHNVQVDFYGDGVFIDDLVKYTEKKNIMHNVNFVGRAKNTSELIEKLHGYNLFFFPSFYEGLPRVIIEAQAAGLPCVASNVGGIPELIDSKYISKPKDVKYFTYIIDWLISHPEELSKLSVGGIKMASNFTSDKLDKKRKDFYLEFKKILLERNQY